MKKMLALLLALVMLLSLSAAAMADNAPAAGEDENPRTLSWITAWRAIRAEELTGDFYKIGDLDLDLWVPDLLTEQEDIPADCYRLFADSTGNATVRVHRISMEGHDTLEEFEQFVVSQGCVSDGLYWINGFTALIYENPGADSLSVDIGITDGTAVEFTFTAVSNEDMYSLSSLILSTIQPHDLDVADVALMMDADLNNIWGESKHVTYAKDGSSITVNQWDEGINADTIQNIKNWETVKKDKLALSDIYESVLQNFNMDEVDLTIQYTDEQEERSFLTIENGEITYDVFA